MEEKYEVYFEDTKRVMTGKELIDFVKVAVVNNKDVKGFLVNKV